MLVKILVFLLVMAVLNVLREGWRLVECFRSGSPYELGKYGLVLYAASLSYIITIIITGLQ